MKKNQCVVIGMGRFGSAVAEELYSGGNDVLAIDIDQSAVNRIFDSVTMAVQVDATKINELKSLAVSNFDVAVVAIGSNIESSIIITLAVKELGVKYIVAKADNDMQARILYSIGADRVIFPEKDMGIRVAHNLIAPNILDFIELSPNHSISSILSLKDWTGKTLKELNLPRSHGISVIGIRREGVINISPKANDTIRNGDILIVVGNNKSLNAFENVITN